MATRTNFVTNPRFAGSSPSYQAGAGETSTLTYVTDATDGPFPWVTNYTRRTIITPKTANSTGFYYRSPVGEMTGLAGDVVSMGMYVRFSHTVNVSQSGNLRMGSTVLATFSMPTLFAVPANTWVRVTSQGLAPSQFDGFQMWAALLSSQVIPAGGWLDAVCVNAELDVVGPYFDGSTPRTVRESMVFDTTWLSGINSSPSTETSSMPLSQERELAGKIQTVISVQPAVLRSYDRVESNLEPFVTTHIRADDAPLLNGYPKATPLWVRVQPVLSSEGQIIGSNRPRPAEVNIDSDVRFVARSEDFDVTTGTWRAYKSTRQNYYMRGPSLTLTPVLDDFSYVSGREVISSSAFRISDGTSFLCEFHDGLDNLVNLSLSMVIAPNPQIKSYPILEWHNTLAPVLGERLALWINDKLDYFWGGTGNSVDPVANLNKTRPLFITVVVSPPKVTVTVSYSPRHQFSTSKVSPLSVRSQWLRFRLGDTDEGLNGDAESDFNLFEFNLWERALSTSEVAVLNATYASTYGVASEWR